jgi:phosphoribosylglycinamide formyltransferase-1
MKEPVGILVGAKGRGSNMAALAAACAAPEYPAFIKIVVAPKADVPAVDAADAFGLPVATVSPGDGFATRLVDALSGCTWICLAGFTRLLPEEVLEKFPSRILNIHPALLPKFGGKGMYGHHVHDAVIAAGEPESGCSVHLVNERYDEGTVLLQLKCSVLPDDDSDTLAARVLKLEHVAYPRALAEAILAGRT